VPFRLARTAISVLSAAHALWVAPVLAWMGLVRTYDRFSTGLASRVSGLRYWWHIQQRGMRSRAAASCRAGLNAFSRTSIFLLKGRAGTGIGGPSLRRSYLGWRSLVIGQAAQPACLTGLYASRGHASWGVLGSAYEASTPLGSPAGCKRVGLHGGWPLDGLGYAGVSTHRVELSPYPSRGMSAGMLKKSYFG
jgi:hypothetical protein